MVKGFKNRDSENGGNSSLHLIFDILFIFLLFLCSVQNINIVRLKSSKQLQQNKSKE